MMQPVQSASAVQMWVDDASSAIHLLLMQLIKVDPNTWEMDAHEYRTSHWLNIFITITLFLFSTHEDEYEILLTDCKRIQWTLKH